MSRHKVQKSSSRHNAFAQKSNSLKQIRPWTNAYQQPNIQASEQPATSVKPPTTAEWLQDNVLLRAIKTRQSELQQQSIQAKLTVGEPGDKYEQEADMMASKVMSMADTAVQRESEEKLQTKPLAEGINSVVQRWGGREDESRIIRSDSPLPYREAVDLSDCNRILGEGSEEFCQDEVQRQESALGLSDSSGAGSEEFGQDVVQRQESALDISDSSGATSLRRHRRGYVYMGDSSQFAAPLAEVVQEFEQEGRLYLATIARGFAVVGEGGPSAINTYDSQVFTLGAGFSGGVLNRLLEGLRGTTLGDELMTIPYLAGLRFNGSERIRTDRTALTRIIEICERHIFMFAKAQVRAFALTTGRGRGDHERQDINERLGNSISPRLDPHVAAIASYLHHGRPGFTPSPSRDLEQALRRSPNNLSGQIAVLLQLHAQRIAREREQDPDLYEKNAEPAVTRRLPNKVSHFIRAKGESASYQFDYRAAQTIIPCLQRGTSWNSTSSAPSSIYLSYEVGGNTLYFDFGQISTRVTTMDSGGRLLHGTTTGDSP